MIVIFHVIVIYIVSFQFIDNNVGHVITGDVNIVKNKKLRNLFKKGYNYIESTFRNKAEIIKSIKIDVSNYICKISNKLSINVRFLTNGKMYYLGKYHVL